MNEIIGFLGSIASISGMSLKSIVESKNDKNSQRKLFDSAHAILVRMQEDNDPLVGYWRLRNWDYTATHLPEYAVSGGLAVHHKEKDKIGWRAIMCLEYGMSLSRKNFRKWGQPHPFIATYNVGFSENNDGSIYGSCHMIEKREIRNSFLGQKIVEPKIKYKWRGEFTDCKVLKSGIARQFIGHYENFPKNHSAGKADFTFHLPIHWGEVTFDQFDT